MDLPSIISMAVHWIILPIILIGLFLYGVVIWHQVSDTDLKAAAGAGFWAGLVLFVIFVVSQLTEIRNPQFDLKGAIIFNPFLIGLGVVSGFGMMFGIRYSVPTRAVGAVVLLLTASSLTALYGYVFIESIRGLVLLLALGVALGTLLYRTFVRESRDNK